MTATCQLFLGTSSWTAQSWNGPFYSPGTPSVEYLTHYATRFRTVEIDSTFYAVPSERVVDGWNARTPEDFVFTAKVPQVITHEKCMADCGAELDEFLTVMRRLGPKLGVLLLQFPYFNRAAMTGVEPFLERLIPFLRVLPPDLRFALEVRNKGWLCAPFLDALRDHGVALAWIDHPYMLTARQYARLPGALTADFLYVRWLGDRHRIEEVTKKWDTLVYDRASQIRMWAEVLHGLAGKIDRIYSYYNNHYAGCAYQNAFQFEEAWEKVRP